MPGGKKKASLDLLSKVLDHELVPRHEILSVGEGVKVLKEYGIKPEQLPWLRASDPVARAIGAKPGDIVKITRKSPTGGEIIVYRYVVPG
jgi:DNA-directed RNA polymerase subunit H